MGGSDHIYRAGGSSATSATCLESCRADLGESLFLSSPKKGAVLPLLGGAGTSPMPTPKQPLAFGKAALLAPKSWRMQQPARCPVATQGPSSPPLPGIAPSFSAHFCSRTDLPRSRSFPHAPSIASQGAPGHQPTHIPTARGYRRRFHRTQRLCEPCAFRTPQTQTAPQQRPQLRICLARVSARAAPGSSDVRGKTRPNGNAFPNSNEYLGKTLPPQTPTVYSPSLYANRVCLEGTEPPELC